MTNEFAAYRRRVLTMGADGVEADLSEALILADYFVEREDDRLAASALDVAYGVCPSDEAIAKRRRSLLEPQAIFDRGVVYRYVPAGTFLMGSESGDRDESPVRPVQLDEYWVADVPTSWGLYCDVLGWEPPPIAVPKIDWSIEANRRKGFYLNQMNKIRLTYCETGTTQGGDWHAHANHLQWTRGGEVADAVEMFGSVPREDPDAPQTFDRKPMVAVGWQEADDMCEILSSPTAEVVLPSEAQWEKAARGGLIGQSYAWGSQSPDDSRCDFGHFGDWVIHDPRRFPPNGYGIHGICGGVWEWTRDWYDALAYADVPIGKNEEPERARVLRGGSWIDCAEAATVSFRGCCESRSWKDEAWGEQASPTIGFRLCRQRRDVS